MSSPSQLEEYVSVFAESKRRARDLAGPLSESQFNWKPSARQWSVGECLDHLNRVARGYVPAMESAVRSADRQGREPFHYGWLSRKFIASVGPGSRRLKTAGGMKPPSAGSDHSELNKDETLAEFEELTDGYIGVVREAQRIDLSAVKVRSPFLWFFRLPVGAFMEGLGGHAIRHLDQAERVTMLDDFPDR